MYECRTVEELRDVERNLEARAAWYRAGCPDVDDAEGYAQSGDKARDLLSDFASALAIIVRLHATIAEQAATIARLEGERDALKSRVAELEARPTWGGIDWGQPHDVVVFRCSRCGQPINYGHICPEVGSTTGGQL